MFSFDLCATFIYLYIIYYYHIYLLYYFHPMKVISLNIDEMVFNETEKLVSILKKPRNRYINEAIVYYNKHQNRLMLEQKLLKESEMVQKDSMNVLRDFEGFDYGH